MITEVPDQERFAVLDLWLEEVAIEAVKLAKTFSPNEVALDEAAASELTTKGRAQFVAQALHCLVDVVEEVYLPAGQELGLLDSNVTMVQLDEMDREEPPPKAEGIRDRLDASPEAVAT